MERMWATPFFRAEWRSRAEPHFWSGAKERVNSKIKGVYPSLCCHVVIFSLPRPEDHHRAKHFDRVMAIASSPPENASFFIASLILRGSQKGGLGWDHIPGISNHLLWSRLPNHFHCHDVFHFRQHDDDMTAFRTILRNPDEREELGERSIVITCSDHYLSLQIFWAGRWRSVF